MPAFKPPRSPDPKSKSAASIAESPCERTVRFGFDLLSVGRALAVEKYNPSFYDLHRVFEGERFYPKFELSARLERMNETEKAMVSSALRGSNSPAIGSVSENGLKRFLHMHAGIRELRMRNFASAAWDAKEWRDDLQKRRDAIINLHSICGIAEPDPKSMMDAVVVGLSELSFHQRDILSQVNGTCEPDLDLSDLSKINSEFTKSPEKGKSLWRKGRIDLLALGDLIHRARFSSDPVFTGEEQALLDRMCDKIGRNRLDLTKPEDFFEVKNTFDNMCPEVNGAHVFYYQPLVISSWLMNKDVNLRSATLRDVARREEEYHTLMEFLGKVPWKSVGKLDSSTILSEPANYRSLNGKTNEDSATSAKILDRKGEVTRVDTLFDGVGGYGCGSVASGLAKGIADVAAMAGWFECPEDMRRVMSMIDITIVMAQIFKGYDLANTIYDATKKYLRTSQINMGTTVTISMQKGNVIHVAHAGDSDCKLIEALNGSASVIQATVPHSQTVGYILIGDRDAYLGEEKKKLAASGLAFEKLPIPQQLQIIASAEKHAEERAQSMSKSIGVTNIVSSFLGGSAHFIQINNSTRNYKPWVVINPEKTFQVLGSDGLWDVECDQDCVYVIVMANGDCQVARSEFMSIAKSRSIEYDPKGVFPGAKEVEEQLTKIGITMSDYSRKQLTDLKDGDDSLKFTLNDVSVFRVKPENGRLGLFQKIFYSLPNGEKREGKDDDRTLNARRADEGFDFGS